MIFWKDLFRPEIEFLELVVKNTPCRAQKGELSGRFHSGKHQSYMSPFGVKIGFHNFFPASYD